MLKAPLYSFLSPLQRALSFKGAEHRQWPGVRVLQCPHNSRGLPQQHGRDGNRWAHSLQISFSDCLLGYCHPQIQWETNPGHKCQLKAHSIHRHYCYIADFSEFMQIWLHIGVGLLPSSFWYCPFLLTILYLPGVGVTVLHPLFSCNEYCTLSTGI